MMERIRTLIWYGAVILLIIICYHLASSYAVALVDEKFIAMKPTLQPNGICFLNRKPAVMSSLATDDVIAFEVFDGREQVRLFGRVIAASGQMVSIRGGRLLVDGNDTAKAPPGLEALETGSLIVPRETVFVVFDAANAMPLPLSKRLVPFRSIIGRVINK